ncbi:hypothetical protein GH714_015484 [Hevea brasiliensis]|uniref:Stress-response A/B barrel domain-containing protein n=1 Tax=Hevea brasiliensis TaxID=3981 RepID=A0A6A6LM94_HEVBR|nr:hypothetical protein GH714_015484 [Hevea brasiliensis]
MKGLEKLVSEIDLVKSFSWGQDLESPEMLAQGFTHAISMTFDKKQDYTAFQTHPNHVEFSATFSLLLLRKLWCFVSHLFRLNQLLHDL